MCRRLSGSIAALVFLVGGIGIAQTQPNSASASMLLNGQAGAVPLGLGDQLTIEFQGTPGSVVLFAIGTLAPNPVALGPGNLYHLDIDARVQFDGISDPNFRIDSNGRLERTYQVPWLGFTGATISAQAAVQDANSSIGFTLTAPSTVSVNARTVQPSHQFFDPTTGANGVGQFLPLAGTLPGDLPTLSRFGFPGPPDITENGRPVHNVFQSPHSCFNCHGSIEEIWPTYSGSMMANSARDPLFHAQFAIAVAGMEWAHQVGLSPEGGELAADFCIRCHAPAAWQGGRSGFAGDGVTTAYHANILDHTKGIDMEGVSCDVCHRIEDVMANVSPTAHRIPGHPDSSQLVFGTSIAKRGPFPGTHSFPHATRTDYGAILGNPAGTMLPPVAHMPPAQPGTAISPVHPTEENPIFRDSTMCGACHNITNPLTGHAIERTFTEWLDSDFSDPTGSDYQTCQDCHMPAVQDEPACSIAGSHPLYGVFAKRRAEIKRHEFVGGNSWIPRVLQQTHPMVDQPWVSGANYAGSRFQGSPSRNTAYENTALAAEAMLGRAAEVDLTAMPSGTDAITAQVRITNKTGHKLPTGYPEGRQMWIHLTAADANGQTIFESGALDANHALVRDPQLKVYEAKQGLEYPNQGLNGSSFHFVLNNAIFKDNRIPPKGAGSRPGRGGNDSYDPVLAPWPTGGLYPPGQHWDDTSYTVPVPAGTPRPITLRATVYYQVASYEYVQFLAAGGSGPVVTTPAPEATMLLNMWHNGLPAPAVPVGQVGATSAADPNATHTGQTAITVVN